MEEETKNQEGWDYGALRRAFYMGAIIVLLMSIILSAEVSGAAGVAFYLNILIGLRILGAYLFKKKGNGWKYYYVLLALSGPVCLAITLIMRSLNMRFEFF